MGKIALGYGSEWHLLRYLGRHRDELTRAVESTTGVTDVRWLDFGFSRSQDREHGFGDAELKGLDFLPDKHPARESWKSYWPQSGNVQNWDAVGKGTRQGKTEWLLVEAKACLEEVKSSCQAKPGGGRNKIESRLAEAKAEIGVDPGRNWMQPYYQYANRLALLRFLLRQGVMARLVFIYFTGDRRVRGTCPRSADAWNRRIEKIKSHLGILSKSEAESRTHQIILPVIGS